MATTHDNVWPRASELLTGEGDGPVLTLLGLSTYRTSLSERSAESTPRAVREALARYSTWSSETARDLRGSLRIRDLGDVDEPDDETGHARVAAQWPPDGDLTVVLGGDNAATWHALSAMAADRYDDVGLVTLDAHFDLREGRSNGSPVRQLLDEGLDGRHVVQLGLADFSNSAHYADVARAAGIEVVPRAAFRHEPAEVLVRRAIDHAARGGRRVYVDIDMDVADRAVVPGCPAAAPGGLSADEVRRVARTVGAHPAVAAMDVTEIDVARDHHENTVRLAALVVLEAALGLLAREP